MSDDSSEGLLMRLWKLFRYPMYMGASDHPMHGGTTGDTDWSHGDAVEAREQTESDGNGQTED